MVNKINLNMFHELCNFVFIFYYRNYTNWKEAHISYLLKEISADCSRAVGEDCKEKIQYRISRKIKIVFLRRLLTNRFLAESCSKF